MKALRMATAAKATTLLARNPALFCRVALSKLSTARKMPALPVRRMISDIAFEYDLEGYRGTAPMYFGSYALLIVEAMKRFLPRGGTFIDVGANIGYLSAVAAGLVGPTGEVHCFEPVPAYVERLDRLARLNPHHKIKVNACAAGEIPGKSTIYVTEEAGQSTMVPAYKQAADIN
ncbi:MAG: FkbM family methyltransferase, partial [Candidatus Acidiferrales bacterium]